MMRLMFNLSSGKEEDAYIHVWKYHEDPDPIS